MFPSRKSSRSPRRPFSASVEALDRREVLSAGVSFVGSTVMINATDHGDSAYVTLDAKNNSNPYDDTINVAWNHDGLKSINTYLRFNKVVTPYGPRPEPNVLSIQFIGGKGNDVFTNGTSLKATAIGYDGDDVLVGGDGGDVLQGGRGSDKIFGLGGDDYLYAGIFSINDSAAPYFVDDIDGGKGQDHLFAAAAGTNILHGGDDADLIFGAYGATTYLYGDAGNDVMYGGYGPKAYNVFLDHEGADKFDGGSGGAGNLFFADDGKGDDTIYVYEGDVNVVYRDAFPAFDSFKTIKKGEGYQY